MLFGGWDNHTPNLGGGWIVPPLQGWVRGGLPTQGGATRLHSRFALPWADMLRPFRANKGM